MTKLMIQHGPAKGQKIFNSMNNGVADGVIFSSREENIESIKKYVLENDFLNKENTFLDPQFYYSTFNFSKEYLKFLATSFKYPNNVIRRDVRKKEEYIYEYFNDYVQKASEISDSIITPGLYVDSIDWKFDASIEYYNYFKEKYNFKNYYLTLILSSKIFHSKNDVDYIVEDLKELINKKDGIYLIITYPDNNSMNYESIDPENLANILYFIYSLKQAGFKLIIGYTFINSILFAMLDCEYVSAGWFNNLRKFNENRFSTNDDFGRRKKKILSKPALSYITLETLETIKDNLDLLVLSSGSDIDNKALKDSDSVSFVDLEHQFWDSIKNILEEINSFGLVTEKTKYILILIKKAKEIKEQLLEHSIGQDVVKDRITEYFKHLDDWEFAIDLFIKKASLIIQ